MVYIIVLNYNNADDTIQCILSIRTINNLPYRLVIVDNNSNCECIEKIKKSLKQGEILIENNKNAGYAYGNNIGIKYAKNAGADYIIVLNNDVIVNELSFKQSIELLKMNKEIICCSPVVLNFDNKMVQTAGNRIDTYKLVGKSLYYNLPFDFSSDYFCTESISGSCMVFRSSAFDIIGYFPEEYVMMWEETEWCLRAIKMGYKLYYCLKSYVEHKGSATINKRAGMMRYYYERNRVLFLMRNFKSVFHRCISFAYITLSCLIKSFFINKECIKYLKYYNDGLNNKICSIYKLS